jgi:hypothetical protein
MLTTTARGREAAVSKGDGPAAAAGPFILRGSLREHLKDDAFEARFASASRMTGLCARHVRSEFSTQR